MGKEVFAERNKLIRARARRGETLASIARAFGLHHSRISQIVKREDPEWFANYRRLANARGREYVERNYDAHLRNSREYMRRKRGYYDRHPEELPS